MTDDRQITIELTVDGIGTILPDGTMRIVPAYDEMQWAVICKVNSIDTYIALFYSEYDANAFINATRKAVRDKYEVRRVRRT